MHIARPEPRDQPWCWWSACNACLHRARAILPAVLGLVLASAAWAGDALPVPRDADYTSILAAKNSEVQVFSYPGRQPIFIIDFPLLSTQGRMFNRVVALVERMGAAQARVLDDQALMHFIRTTGKTELTFAYGNDFLVHELVVFFNLAEHGGIDLTSEEQALRNFLLEQGLMRERFGFLQALRPNAVILSVPQIGKTGNGPTVSTLARQTILMHEISHAEFYTNPLYRAWCRKFWRVVLTDKQRAALRGFLVRSGYDGNNEELLINEMQAYLLYTPDPRAFNAQAVGVTEADLQAMRKAFMEGFPDAPLVKH